MKKLNIWKQYTKENNRKMRRSLNSKRNIISGLVQQIIGIILPFINRTAVLWILGAEYQGLSSLFNSILSVLSMAELGLSSAIVYSMYAPIAEGNTEKVNALLNYFKRAYLVIGTVITTLGLLLMLGLPSLIKGDIPADINLYALYLLYLANTTSSYFFFAYRSTVLSANQRSDVINNVHSIIKLLSCISQFLLLMIFRNYYAYVIVIPIFTTLSNLIIAIFSKKVFLQYRPVGKLDNETRQGITKQVSGLMINKVGDVARNSFDSIVISSMIGLITVAVYSNYYYIFSCLYNIMLIITNSMGASIGNSIAKEGQRKNYQDFKRLSFCFSWLTGWFTICLLCLYQPFMKVWTGEGLLLPEKDMILFCCYFYLINCNNIRNVYFAGNGLWWKAKHLFILEAIGNLVLNFVLGYLLGITGILLATIITIFVFNFYSRSKLLYQCYFTEYMVSQFWKMHLIFMCATLVNALVCYGTTMFIKLDGIAALMIYGVICAMLPNVIYFLLYRKWRLFEESLPWIKRIIRVK